MAIDLSPEKLDELSFDLGKKFRDDAKRNGTFDALVYMPRGGFRVADVVGRMLGFDSLGMHAFAIATRGVDHGIKKPVFGQVPDKKALFGLARVALVDDVYDSGLTNYIVSNVLLTEYNVQEVVTGHAVYKPDMNQYKGFVEPDHVSLVVPGVDIEEIWVNFPGEKYDDFALTEISN